MAEALAIVSVVSNIVQLVDFGDKVLRRLNDFQSRTRKIPKAFRNVKAELPILLLTLEETKSSVENGKTDRKTREAILRVVRHCMEQISLLNSLIKEALPKRTDSWSRKAGKAILSLKRDAQVDEITTNLRKHIQSLAHYQIAKLSKIAIRKDEPSSSPKPSSTVPFRRDEDFVDRDIMYKIQAKCSRPASRVALVGFGGVGKSQLAIEYSYRVREQSPEVWVFWVHAGNKTRFEDDYRIAAKRARMPGWDSSNVDILRLVTDWLQDEANGKWLMIVDNADDGSLFSLSQQAPDDESNRPDSMTEDLSKFLPQSQNGAILVTSRSQEVALKITGASRDIIAVTSMDETHAMNLLCSKLEGPFNYDDAKTLVQALDCMPLAISQAAAFINQRRPLTSVSQYLKDLQKMDTDQARLLSRNMTDNRRDGKASNLIMAVWNILFENLRREKPSAARLLSFMCLFDRRGIQRSLLDHYYEAEGDEDLDEDIHTLRGFRFIGTNLHGTEFEMHRLIQFSMKTWLELRGELETWKENFIVFMYSECPSPKFEHWQVWRKLFPHAQKLVDYRPASSDYFKKWSLLVHQTAVYAMQQGLFNFASITMKTAVDSRTQVYGPEGTATLASSIMLASIYRHLGWLEEAEELQIKVLEIEARVLGDEHLSTLVTMSNLARTYGEQGRWKEAEDLHIKVLEIQARVLGDEHPSTLVTMNNLAETYGEQGRWKEAEDLHIKVLNAHVRVLGDEHPNTLKSMFNVAYVWKSLGRDAEALELMQKCAGLQKKLFGLDHPDTVLCISQLNMWQRDT